MKMTGADKGEMDSLYASGEGDSPAPKETKTVDQEEATDDATALVPLKILQAGPSDQVKVGDERVLKVVAVHGDEAEVSYSKTPASEIGKEGQSADEELDAMDKEGSY